MEWPVYRQLTGSDPTGRSVSAVASQRTRQQRPRGTPWDRSGTVSARVPLAHDPGWRGG